jgi:hypothetical protein
VNLISRNSSKLFKTLQNSSKRKRNQTNELKNTQMMKNCFAQSILWTSQLLKNLTVKLKAVTKVTSLS